MTHPGHHCTANQTDVQNKNNSCIVDETIWSSGLEAELDLDGHCALCKSNSAPFVVVAAALIVSNIGICRVHTKLHFRTHEEGWSRQPLGQTSAEWRTKGGGFVVDKATCMYYGRRGENEE